MERLSLSLVAKMMLWISHEGWMGKYERMSEANEWVGDVSDKDISGKK